ncbi:glycine dehydrogenase [Maribacter sp. HTCC2170]|nr:glycine dehydrogenase [Maribacter sp. HTCC2170]
MISCDEAAIICNKKQYKEATFIEKIKLMFHILICKTCSKFSKKNSELTSLCDKAPLHSIPEKEKVEMKKELAKKL